MSWRDEADRVLEALWATGEPTTEQIYAAYPFGMRKYTPYKTWLEEVRWFKAGRLHLVRRNGQWLRLRCWVDDKKSALVDPAQERMFA